MCRQFSGRTGIVVVGILFLANLSVYAGLPVEAPFTYQGQLRQNGVPVTDTCDFEFTLWNDPVGVSAVEQVGPTLAFDGVKPNPAPIDIVNGLFSVELDFTVAAFTDNPRWLEISFSCPTGSGIHMTLTPRERVTAAPMSIHTRGITVRENGNVGLGTRFPNAQLDVAGHVQIALMSSQLSTMADSMRKIEHLVSTQSLRKGKVVSATVQP